MVVGTASDAAETGLDGGYKRRGQLIWPHSFSSEPRLPASDKECGCAGCMGKREPFKGMSLRDVITIFTRFRAILEKSRLVDLLVRLINKLYPMQHHFEVYAWMFL